MTVKTDNRGESLRVLEDVSKERITRVQEEGSEEEVEGEEGEEMQVGEGGDDEDYEREVPSPSDIDDCDWSGLSCRIHDIPDKCLSPLLSHSVHPESVTLVFL